MSNIFVTSDTHWNHEKLLEYTPETRPFETVKRMNQEMVKCWNKRVGRDDVVYHLGDVTLGSMRQADLFLSQVHGHVKVLTYPSHHDKRWLPRGQGHDIVYRTLDGIVEFLPGLLTLELGAVDPLGSVPPIILCHFKMETWENKHYGSWHLFGHSHQPEPFSAYNKGWCLNVGVDAWGLGPANLVTDIAPMMIGHGYGSSSEWVD